MRYQSEKALVGEISISIRLFVMAIQMHYSSEIRKSSVLFVMVRLQVFIFKVLHFMYSFSIMFYLPLIAPLCAALVQHHLEYCSQCWETQY